MDVSISPPVNRSSLRMPDELVLEILSRLPSKAIARFRCVSKLWASFLHSPYFTELFLTRSCAHPQILFAFHDDREVVFFSSPQPDDPKENSYVVAANQLARFPCSYGFAALTRGFFCDVAEQTYTFEGMKLPEYVPLICNPSTGQSLTMPRINSQMKFGLRSCLGYEPIGKQLKVLSRETACAIAEWLSASHQVLTLGTDEMSWRFVECDVPHCPSTEYICISGVIYYTATNGDHWLPSSPSSMVVCFDLRSETFSFVKFMETSSREMLAATTPVNYNGKLGLLMSSGDSLHVSGATTSLELWVLGDAGKNEWSKHVYVLPTMWKDVVVESMFIAGMVGVNEIVLAPRYQNVPSYVIYYNVERKTVTRVGINGMEAFQGKRFYTFLNYVENVEFL